MPILPRSSVLFGTPNCVGMKLMESARKNSKSKGRNVRALRFPLCLNNDGYPASLEVGKIYRELRPHPLDIQGWVRVVDESGEDYLFPSHRFVPVELPPKAKRALNFITA